MDNKYNWSFTVNTNTLEGTRVEQHTAEAGASHWLLLETDGEPPSGKAQNDYRNRKQVEAAERDPHAGNGFDSLADPDSFELVQETDTHAVYIFQPAPDSEDDIEMSKMLRGLMTINKDGPYVQSFQLSNRGKIKAAPMVRIHNLRVDVQFGPAAEGGPYVPVLNKTVIDGKMAGIKKIHQDTTIKYSNYKAAR